MAADPDLERFLALPPEQRVLDRFRLVAPLGKGGFAPVWRATETYGDQDLREVAMKLFTVKAADSSGSARAVRARKDAIVAEARALCMVEHPNVVRFYNFASDASGNVFGLVMEYVRGTGLDRMLESRGKLDAAETVDVGIAVASALAAVHAQGIVHRDIKPANVVHAKGVYKVIDFGIASAGVRAFTTETGAPKERLVMDDLPIETGHTKVSLAVGGAFESMSGTVGYVDPMSVSELRPADAMGDLYALGATLFECLTGSLPAVAHAKLLGRSGLSGEVLDGRARAPSVAKMEPGTPAALVRLVDSLLAPDPAERPGSADEVLAALRAVPAAEAPRRSSGALAFIAVAAALAIGVAVFAVTRGRGDAQSAAPTPSSSSPASAAPALSPATPPEAISPRHRCADAVVAGKCVPWCNVEGVQVSCCPPGEAPLGPDAVCSCPPGGSDALGCQPSSISSQERDRQDQAAFEAVTPAIRQCWRSAGADAADAADAGGGTVTVEVELSPVGTVFSAHVTRGDIPSEAVQRCLLGALRQAHFPAPVGGSAKLTVPFAFAR